MRKLFILCFNPSDFWKFNFSVIISDIVICAASSIRLISVLFRFEFWIT
nr:MAG TPA: hypothetical protein [Bacteriophage sp.]